MVEFFNFSNRNSTLSTISKTLVQTTKLIIIYYSSIACEQNKCFKVFKAYTVINIWTMMIHSDNTLTRTAMWCSWRLVFVILFTALICISVYGMVISQEFFRSWFYKICWWCIRYYDRFIKGEEAHRIQYEWNRSHKDLVLLL